MNRRRLSPGPLIWLTVIVAMAGVAIAAIPSDPRDRLIGPVTDGTLVIVTFDGVRLRELFEGPSPALLGEADADAQWTPGETVMPHMMDALRPRGTFLGSPYGGTSFGLGNPIGISMPSYQSMFAGPPVLCVTNECAAPRRPTVFERVRDHLVLEREQMAMYANYDRLCDGLGLTDKPDILEARCGRESLDPAWQRALREQGADPRPLPSSTDHAVFELGMHRLKNDPPQLLYLAFDESDSHGHGGRYGAYLQTLARYDDYLRQIDEALEGIRRSGRPATLVVTTDHGRGHGEHWASHRWNVPGTSDLWLLAVGSGIAKTGSSWSDEHYSLDDVGPTIEYLMGARPRQSIFGGRVIEAILEQSVPFIVARY